MEKVFAYRKRNLRIWLSFFFVWIAYGILLVVVKSEFDLQRVILLVGGISIFGGLYLYQRINNYLVINNDSIRVHGPLGEEMAIADVRIIDKDVLSYEFRTESDKLDINARLIDRDLLPELENEIEKLSEAVDRRKNLG